MALIGRIRSTLSIQGILPGPAAAIHLQLPPPKKCTKSAKLILQLQVNNHPIVSTNVFHYQFLNVIFILFCNTGCDSAHVIGMVEPMDRPLVSNGEKLGQRGLFTLSPLEDLHQKSLNYTETQWRDDCGPPAPHSSENDLLESSGPKDQSNWYKEIFMNVAREMIHEAEMRIGTLPVQDPSNGLFRQHQFSPMEPLPNNEGYLKDFLGAGISNAKFSVVQNGSLLDTAMNKSHGSGGAATPLTGE